MNSSNFLKSIFFIFILMQFAPPLFKTATKYYNQLLDLQSKVGYLPIKGIIHNSSHSIRYLKKFFKDKSIKAILLFIESPGGAAGSAEAIAHEIELLRKEYPKPIITLTENILASGGYYIAAATDYIIGPPSALIGSIGTTIPGQFKLDKFMKQFNIDYNSITAGDNKAATDPFVETTPDYNALLQSVVESSYQNFLNHVATHRLKLSLTPTDTLRGPAAWANGKIFTGLQALKIGLIDAVGSKSDAVQKLKKMALIENTIEWVKPAQPMSIMNFFYPSDPGDPHESLMRSLMSSLMDKVIAILVSHFSLEKIRIFS